MATRENELTTLEKEFLLRAFLYFSDYRVFAKLRALLPVQTEKMFQEYWKLPPTPAGWDKVEGGREA